MEASKFGILKLSSIPGRIRLKFKGFGKYSPAIFSICNHLRSMDGIKSASGNLYSSSILILYDTNCIDELFILKSLAAFNPENTNDCMPACYMDSTAKAQLPHVIKYKKLFGNEHLLSRRVLKFGAILSLLSYVSASSLLVSLSILILCNPLIFYYIKLKAYGHVKKRYMEKGIFVNSSIFGIDLNHEVILDKNLLKASNCDAKFNDFPAKNHPAKHIDSYKMMSELINPQGMKLVCSLRSHGFIKLSAFFSHTSKTDRLIANFAGIEKIICSENDFSGTNAEIFIFFDDTRNAGYEHPNLITVCVTRLPAEKPCRFDASLDQAHLSYIPSILIMPVCLKRIISTYENVSLTVNMFMILLSILKFIDPLGSVILYLLNMIVSTSMLGRTLCLKEINT